MPYVLWITAFNTTFLLGYLLLDALFYSAPNPRKERRDKIPRSDTFVSTRVSSMDGVTAAGDASVPDRNAKSSVLAIATASSLNPSLANGGNTSPSGSKFYLADDPLSPTTFSAPVLRSNSTSRARAPKRTYSHRAHDSEDEASTSPISSFPRPSRPRRAPELLEAINKNGLAVFLLVRSLDRRRLLPFC